MPAAEAAAPFKERMEFAQHDYIVQAPRLLDPIKKSVPGLTFEAGPVIEASRTRSEIAADLQGVGHVFSNVIRIMDRAGDYAIDPSGGRTNDSTEETIYALLAGAAALQREALAKIATIENELTTGVHDADPA